MMTILSKLILIFLSYSKLLRHLFIQSPSFSIYLTTACYIHNTTSCLSFSTALYSENIIVFQKAAKFINENREHRNI